MADPENIGMDDLIAAFATLGVDLGPDVVSLQLIDAELRIERVIRNQAGLPERSECGGVRSDWSAIPLLPKST